jgi:hypothetical protein
MSPRLANVQINVGGNLPVRAHRLQSGLGLNSKSFVLTRSTARDLSRRERFFTT